jgi:predicted MFS family arabinose efflux permease
MLPGLVGMELLPASNAIFQSLFQTGAIVGPAIAGLLLAGAGVHFIYWLDVASYLVAMTAVLTMSPQPAPAPGTAGASTARPGWRSTLEGLRFVRRSQPVQGAYIIDVNAMVFGMPRALFPALAVTVYGGGAATVGYLNAAPGLGALVGSLLTGHVWRVRRAGRSVAVCVVIWGLAITGFGFASWLPGALALLVVAGAADVVSSVFRMMIVQQVTPDAIQGRVNSLIFVGLQGGPRLGDAESGAAAAVAGPQFAAWSGGLISVVTAVVTCWAIPQFWRYRNETGQAHGPGEGPAAGPGARPDGESAGQAPGASGAAKRRAGWRASGTTSREGGR